MVNQRDTWVRADGAFPSIVDRALFERARAIIDQRGNHYSDEELLYLLQAVLDQEGSLSGLIIDERDGMPSSSFYRSRFGSLLRAYSLIGYTPDRDYRYIEINRHIRESFPALLADIVAGLEGAGGTVVCDSATPLLLINQEFTVSIVLARSFETQAGALRWQIRFDTGLVPDVTVAVRLDRANHDRSNPKHVNTIPIDQIRLLNPRARNQRNFQEIVQSIASVGLKRPITVSPKSGKTLKTTSFSPLCACPAGGSASALRLTHSLSMSLSGVGRLSRGRKRSARTIACCSRRFCRMPIRSRRRRSASFIAFLWERRWAAAMKRLPQALPP